MTINLRQAREEAKNEIANLLRQGWSYERIAFAIGCSVSLVYSTAKKDGLTKTERVKKDNQEKS